MQTSTIGKAVASNSTALAPLSAPAMHQPMQRAMQQAEPLVRLAVAAHLVQAQQRAGQRIHRAEHRVDEDGLLGHVHHPAEEAQHDEVGEEGRGGPAGGSAAARP